jgi:hypothetical protein
VWAKPTSSERSSDRGKASTSGRRPDFHYYGHSSPLAPSLSLISLKSSSCTNLDNNNNNNNSDKEKPKRRISLTESYHQQQRYENNARQDIINDIVQKVYSQIIKKPQNIVPIFLISSS